MAVKRAALLRYTLFQLPGVFLLGAVLLLLRAWFDIPPWTAWGIFLIWIAKDAALFPLLWRSYCTSPAGEMNSIIGREGLVREELAPSGRVQVGGEIWHAEVMPGCAPARPGEAVSVRDIRGLTLIVELSAVGRPDGAEPGGPSTGEGTPARR